MPEDNHMYGKKVQLGTPISELVAHIYRNPEPVKSTNALGWNTEFMDRRHEI